MEKSSNPDPQTYRQEWLSFCCEEKVDHSYHVMWSVVSASAENTGRRLRSDPGSVDREKRSGSPAVTCSAAALCVQAFYMVLSKTLT